jgi:hypothetical protein
MKRTAFSVCCAVAFTAVIVSAQDKNMPTTTKDHMSIEKTYSGCVESSQAGSYSLTHVMAADGKTSMPGSAGMKQAESMKKDAMAKEAMMPATLTLVGSVKQVSKYVGRRVTVSGSGGDSMNGMMTFKVKSLHAAAGSCA